MESKNNEVILLLREILKWTRFAGLKGIKEQIEVSVETDQKKRVYQLSDGKNSINEINKLTGASTGAISGYWKKWVKQGLGETIAVAGGDRFVRAFDLEDLGIEVPQVEDKKSNKKSEGATIETSLVELMEKADNKNQ